MVVVSASLCPVVWVSFIDKVSAAMWRLDWLFFSILQPAGNIQIVLFSGGGLNRSRGGLLNGVDLGLGLSAHADDQLHFEFQDSDLKPIAVFQFAFGGNLFVVDITYGWCF